MFRILARNNPRKCCFRSARLSSKSSSKDDKSKNTEKSRDSAENKRENDLKLPAQKIQSILASMKVSKSSDKEISSQLDLARPSAWTDIKSRLRPQPQEHPELVEEKMLVKAVKEVASNLGGDVEKTESELLQKLRLTDQNAPAKNIKDIFTGIKIDRSKRKYKPGAPVEESEAISNFVDVLDETRRRHIPRDDGTLDNNYGGFRRSVRDSTRKPQIETLFEDGPGLELLSNFKVGTDEDILKTWDFLRKREMRLLVTHPPVNVFEEMIQWTEQGKLWQFPIDNEIGLDEEGKVSFDKHVFLEEYLEDGFPKRGPVRHFMELVVVGLSKNPYLTVQQKLDHIDWFRQYFKAKEPLLKEIGAI